MFSQTAEYALRAAIAMARQADCPLTTAQIAEQTKAPLGYLSKVLQTLTREGLVKASRGLHGGYQLRKAAAELTILDVINAVDPLKRIHTCPLELPEHGECLCLLHRRMDDALAEVERAFAGTTLADLLSEPAPGAALCPGPGHIESD